MTTTHHICQAAGAGGCPCGATAGQPCACEAGHVHVARVCACAGLGLITSADAASVIYPDEDGFFSGMQTIADPGEPPPELDVPRAAYALAAEGAL